MKIEQQVYLPLLRDDLQLREAPPERDGAPAWTLYDPLANKYYKIGWLEFEALARFRSCRTPEELSARLIKETTLRPTAEDMKALVNFVINNHLVVTSGEGAPAHFEEKLARTRRPWWEKMLHGYLFFTVPLVEPQKILRQALPYVAPLLTRKFLLLMLAVFIYGVYLSSQRFDELVTTFMNYFNIEGVLLLLVALIIVKVVHELGHAFIATKHGVAVTTVGVAFIVMYPVLYTETTNAWQMTNRRARLEISLGGLMAEFALSAICLVLWHWLDAGLGQSICFMIAVVSFAASLAVNLNPLMKFDGYYIFSDLTGFDNLQDRAFAFVKWHLRRWLWRWHDQPPEVLRREDRRFLTSFGFTMMTYRFFLYLGIALVVYHLFFQPLGLILMVVEIGFFIGMPIWRELKVWLERRSDITGSKRGRLTLAAGGFATLLLFIPIGGSVEVPAVMHAREIAKLYPPAASMVSEILVKEGQEVVAGQVLLRLTSPDLDHEIKKAERKVSDLRNLRDSSQAVQELLRKRLTIDNEIKTATEELQGYYTLRDQLEVKAAFDGRVKMLDDALAPGQWVRQGQLMATLADDSGVVVSGYVREKDVARLKIENSGVFYPEFSLTQKYPVVLSEVADASAPALYWAELSTLYKGEIPTEEGGQGEIRPLPRHAVYAARFTLGEGAEAPPAFVARGAIRVDAERQSVASALIKKGISVFVFEGGF